MFEHDLACGVTMTPSRIPPLMNPPRCSPSKRTPRQSTLDGNVALKLPPRRHHQLLEQAPLHVRPVGEVYPDVPALEVPVGVVVADGDDLPVRAAREEEAYVLEFRSAELSGKGAAGRRLSRCSCCCCC